MKLKNLGPNCNLVIMSNGAEFLFSYETCVAVTTGNGKTYKTSKKWSKTTSKHINMYLNSTEAQEIDQSFLDTMEKETGV